MMDSKFKKKHSFSKRKAEAQRVLNKYSQKVPVIVEKANESTLPYPDKCKYLVPKDLSLSQFMFVIRKRIKIPPEKAIILFVNNKVLSGSTLISQIYEEEKDDDLFLYCCVTQESTFG